MAQTGPASRRLPAGVLIPAFALAAAGAWLVARVWLGLDFTDEMQYYGEIAGLVRSGKFFHDDLFLQQLGYVFVWPFFKLHALVFPDLQYLVLFGRMLLLAGYAGAGAYFWRATGRSGAFTTSHRVAAVAVLLAWIPFQMFAFSYNTSSYLVLVVLVAAWLQREAGALPAYPLVAGAWLTVLTYTYPPAGLALIGAAALEVAGRSGPRDALRLVAATAAAGLGVALVIFLGSGPALIPDLQAAMALTRGFGAGLMILQPDNLGGLLVTLLGCGLFIWRARRGAPFGFMAGSRVPLAVRWLALCLAALTGVILLPMAMTWNGGFFTIGTFLDILLLLAAATPPATMASGPMHLSDARLIRRTMLGLLVAGILAIFIVLFCYLRPGTGYFAHAVFLTLLAVLALDEPAGCARPCLLAVGTAAVAGTVFSISSGNGLHNFGIGAAAVLPLLVLHACRHLDNLLPVRLGSVLLMPALVLLFLLNGALHPYAEQAIWHRFEPIEGVPAFRGIRASALKVEAIARLSRLAPREQIAGKRILVVGPQPWIYFVLGGRPCTPMFFMHFDGKAAVDEIVGERLFHRGEPDVIVLTTRNLPAPVREKVFAWSHRSLWLSRIQLPSVLVTDLLHETGYRFSTQVDLMDRSRARP